MHRSSPQTIYVDMDDVLCEAAHHFLAVVARERLKLAKEIPLSQVVDWSLVKEVRDGKSS